MLVEMVAALALTGLLLAFVLPSPTATRTSAARFAAVVTGSAALFRDARSEAIAQARPVFARFEPRARLLRTPTRQMAIPADVDVALTTGGSCSGGGAGARILFRPDGTNCGGVLRLARGAQAVRVRVEWANGRIDVVPGG